MLSKRCSTNSRTTNRRSWSARRCWPRATTSRTSPWSRSSASTRVCTASISMPVKNWRNWSCRSRAAREMLDERRALELPPFAHMVLLRVEAADRDSLDAFLDAARNAFPADDHVRANDPMPAPMPLRAGRHRAQLLVESATRAPLRHALSVWWPRLQQLPQPRTLPWLLGVAPVDLY